MIDIHTHILPGIDDGARNMRESLAMAREAWSIGTEVMVATPHFLPGIDKIDKVSHALAMLQRELELHSIPLQLCGGGEVEISGLVPGSWEKGEIPFLNFTDNPKAILVEFPFSGLPKGAEEVLYHLVNMGITPILAHPERAVVSQRELLRRITPMVEEGVLFQIDAPSLVGLWGREIKERTEILIRKGFCHIMASDCHGRRGLMPQMLADALTILERIVGEEKAQEMVWDNPLKVLDLPI
jgi:protein-tyrosine phosphatase